MSSSSSEPFALAEAAANALAERTGVRRHDVVVVLGSGWSEAADGLGQPTSSFATSDLPGLKNVSIIREDAVDTNDAGFPLLAGHEMGHALLNQDPQRLQPPRPLPVVSH